MGNKESHRKTPKIDPSLLDTRENSRPLRKPLSPDAMTKNTHREYMDELNKARKIEAEEDNGNASGQTNS